MKQHDSPPQRPLLIRKKAAAWLAISDRTLWTLTNRGDIKHIRIGRSVRYDPTDIEAWIKKNRRGGR